MLETYFHLETEGMNLNRIATFVKKNYPYEDPPSLGTIKTYLKEYYQERKETPPWKKDSTNE